MLAALFWWSLERAVSTAAVERMGDGGVDAPAAALLSSCRLNAKSAIAKNLCEMQDLGLSFKTDLDSVGCGQVVFQSKQADRVWYSRKPCLVQMCFCEETVLCAMRPTPLEP